MTNVIHGIVASGGLCITTFCSIKAIVFGRKRMVRETYDELVLSAAAYIETIVDSRLVLTVVFIPLLVNVDLL